MGPIESHLEALRLRFPALTVRLLPSGQTLVEIPQVVLPQGWNKSATAVRYIVPPAYPMAPPDCFWADVDLRLADGRMPQNTGFNPIPEANLQVLWFSWHIGQHWRPGRTTLSNWMSSISDRFERRQ